ncbi:MAG: hypothetical protein AAF564_05300 [Bacteroidota bacterium]
MAWLLVCVLGFASCESSAPVLEKTEALPTAETPSLAMRYSVSQVSEARTTHNVDQRAMTIEGVLSVGVAGNSNEDAWIQIQCADSSAVSRARAALGDSLAGIPIHFSLSDSIKAQ